MDFESLKELVDGYTKTKVLQKSDVRILISELGGRVLSVDFGFGNLLWTNPNLKTELDKGGWNLGGIRTWLAPEQAFFYELPETFENWYCQKELDPAKYALNTINQDTVELTTEIKIKNRLNSETITGQIMKTIQLLSNKVTNQELSSKVKINTSLEITSTNMPVALWCLVQVPTTNYPETLVIIPSLKIFNPIHYFTKIPTNYLNQSKNSLSFILDGNNELKLAINPEDLVDPDKYHIIFKSSLNNYHTKIIMKSTTGPTNQEDCIDVAKREPTGLRGAIQFYNSDVKTSGLKFGELEMQSKPTISHDDKLISKNKIDLTFVASKKDDL